jgi:hypothetical protein
VPRPQSLLFHIRTIPQLRQRRSRAASHDTSPWGTGFDGGALLPRSASGVVLSGLGVVTLSFGGSDRKTYGWAAPAAVAESARPYPELGT